MPAVQTPILEIDEELQRVLSPSFNYYDRPPDEYEVPYVQQLRIDTPEVSQPTTGYWSVDTVAHLLVVVDPNEGERATSFAMRVIAELNAAIWVLDGFAISQTVHTATEKITIQGVDEEDLDRVIIEYTFRVDWLC